MLECAALAIQERVRTWLHRSHEIRNVATGELVGAVRQSRNLFLSFAGKLLGRTLAPRFVEVVEMPDESLLFTLERKGSLWSSRIEVRDALGALVGTLRKSKSSPVVELRDRNHQPLAVLIPGHAETEYSFLTPDEMGELGMVLVSGKGLAVQRPTIELRLGSELFQVPPMKMLLLAATLAALG